MGWTFSDIAVDFRFSNSPTRVHTDGNNVAWSCPNCSNPVLFVYRHGRVGSSRDNPVVCSCGKSYYLEPGYGQGPEPPKGQPEAPANPMIILEL